MKISYLSLALLALLSLAACQSQEPEPLHPTSAPEQTLSAGLELGAQISLFDREALIEESSTRAVERQQYDFLITDGENKYIIGDNGRNTNMPSKRAHLDRQKLEEQAATLKFYVQVRRKSDKSIVGKLYSKWEYKSRNTKDWRLNGADISLTDVTPGTDELEVRVVVGGDLDAATGRIEVKQPVYEEIDLSAAKPTVKMPVPFASDWQALHYDAAKRQYTTEGDALIKLKPLGVMIISTVRSTMSEQMQVSGLRYVTNALAFVGHYDLDGADKLRFVGEGNKMTIQLTQDTYFSQVYNFKQPITLSSSPNHKAFVIWANPTGKEPAVRWQTNNQAYQRGDISTMILQPQTHIYAEGAVNAATKQPVAKPNYKVVPIMGTNSNFVSGKSVALNAELYEQPNQILGYFAKYSVKADGTGFDTSHEPKDVSLVNWKIARDFLAGKKLKGADGQEATFKMGNEAMAVFMGNFFGYVWTENFAGSMFRLFDDNHPEKGGVNAQDRPTLVNFGTDATADIAEGTRSVMRTYIRSINPNACYCIYGRELNLGELRNRGRSRSKDQCLVRIEAAGRPGETAFPLGTTKLSSVYLGKYFVGTCYSPMVDDKPAYQEDLWTDGSFTPGMVKRTFPAAGYYKQSDWRYENPNDIADVDNIYPNNQTREELGKRPQYWYWIKAYNYMGTGNLMKFLQGKQHWERNGAQWLTDPKTFVQPTDQYTAGNILFFPANNSGTLTGVNLDAKYMWQTLWTIADKYQGDDAE